jgi:hypothetical protein
MHACAASSQVQGEICFQSFWMSVIVLYLSVSRMECPSIGLPRRNEPLRCTASAFNYSLTL